MIAESIEQAVAIIGESGTIRTDKGEFSFRSGWSIAGKLVLNIKQADKPDWIRKASHNSRRRSPLKWRTNIQLVPFCRNRNRLDFDPAKVAHFKPRPDRRAVIRDKIAGRHFGSVDIDNVNFPDRFTRSQFNSHENPLPKHLLSVHGIDHDQGRCPMIDPLVSAEVIAKRLSCSPRQVLRLASQNKISCHRISGRLIRFDMGVVEKELGLRSQPEKGAAK